MFRRQESNDAETPAGRPEFPPAVEYEVLAVDAHGNRAWEKITGHNCQIDNGHLVIMRGVFMNEECTAPGAVPAAFFAPGEWRRVKTDHKGFTPKSELAIH